MGSMRTREDDIARMVERWQEKTSAVGLEESVALASGMRKNATTPVPVRAQVPVLVSHVETRELPGRVVAWTPKAVLVEVAIDGVTQFVWLWGGAVERV